MASSKLFDLPAGVLQIGVGLRKTETDETMPVDAGEECFPRYAGYPRLVKHIRGARFARLTGQPRHIGEDIIGALRHGTRQTGLAQSLAKAISLCLIVTGQADVEGLGQFPYADGHAILEGRRRADIEEVVHGADQPCPAWLRDTVSDPPTGDTEGLGIAAYRDGALCHPGERGDAHVL